MCACVMIESNRKKSFLVSRTYWRRSGRGHPSDRLFSLYSLLMDEQATERWTLSTRERAEIKCKWEHTYVHIASFLSLSLAFFFSLSYPRALSGIDVWTAGKKASSSRVYSKSSVNFHAITSVRRLRWVSIAMLNASSWAMVQSARPVCSCPTPPMPCKYSFTSDRISMSSLSDFNASPGEYIPTV